MAFLGIPAVAAWLGGGTTGTLLASALYGGAAGGIGAKATGGDWKKGALKGAGLGAGAGLFAPGMLGIEGGAGAAAAPALGAEAGEGMVAGQSLGATEAAAHAAEAAKTAAAAKGTFGGLLQEAGKGTAKELMTQQALAAMQPEVTTTNYAPPLQWLDMPQLQWGPMLR